MRTLVLWMCSAGFTAALLGQELPIAGPPDRLGFEPDLTLTGPGSAVEEPAAPAPAADVAKLEASLARARRNTTSLDRLFKVGAAAKVEVERSALKEVVLKKDIALAKLRIAQAELEQLRAKPEPGEAAASALKAAEQTVEAADAAARQETAACQKAQLDAAQLNLYRWQRLLTVGAARKVDVSRAQEQLAALQRAQAAP